MQDIIKRDIIEVLSDLTVILRVREEKGLGNVKELSNHVVHNASIFQDEDSVSVAVLIYSISKVLERGNLNYDKILGMINQSLIFIKSNQDDQFRKSIREIFNYIRTLDNKMRMYIYEVINQAQIKKGCKLCEHGISVARAAEVLGISRWELMHYVGKTTFVDQFNDSTNVSKRVKNARSMFS